jgi:hypothetical protein
MNTCQTILVSLNFVTSQCIVVLFGTSSSGSLTKFFTNSSKRFRWEVMLLDEHTICSLAQHVLHLQSLCATGIRSGLATRVTLNRVSRRVGRVYCMGWTCFWLCFCTVVWLFLGFVSNGTPYGLPTRTHMRNWSMWSKVGGSLQTVTTISSTVPKFINTDIRNFPSAAN